MIKSEVKNNVGWILLNRPEKLNALSYEMIKDLNDILNAWKDDDGVKLVVMEGAGEKAFSAGGDVHHLYLKQHEDIESYAFGFFYTEYCMNMLMHLYPKPIVTYMNGITMGGGVGVAVAGSHRIVNEKTKWAMPEMNIGLYPDVAGSYFLNKAPGFIGTYLALTSTVIKPQDVLFANAADYYLTRDKWTALRKLLLVFEWGDNVKEQLEFLIDQHQTSCDETSKLEKTFESINDHFKHDTVEEILDSLKASNVEYAREIYDILMSKSPTSLKVTLEQLRRGVGLDIKACLVMELNMSMNFMKYHDFFEGVRSVLVDKDRNPQWQPNTLAEVSKKTVDSYFSYEWERGNPLMNFEPLK